MSGANPGPLVRLILTALIVAAAPGAAQTEVAKAQAAQTEAPALTAEEVVRLALEQSPAVTAARSRLESAAAGVRGARAVQSPG